MATNPAQFAPQTNPENDTEEPYNSASDEDFDPDDVDGKDTVPSESSDEDVGGDGDGKGKRAIAAARKRKVKAMGDGDGLGALESGDEATVRRGRKKRLRRGKGKDGGSMDGDVGMGEEEDDEGGEGGLVKTRAQRAREEKERRPLASAENATVDVDALWRDMNSARKNEDAERRTGPEPELSDVVHGMGNGAVVENGTRAGQTDPTPLPKSNAPSAEEMITIKRTYVFAGETITEEKKVPITSAEARLYLRSLDAENGSTSAALSMKPPLRRPKKRTSMFEPNPEGMVKGLTPTGASANKGPKLNTIEKSKLDWAGFVDKEGIQEELDGAGKAKEGYLGRMDFLGRVEAKREEEVKGARKK